MFVLIVAMAGYLWRLAWQVGMAPWSARHMQTARYLYPSTSSGQTSVQSTYSSPSTSGKFSPLTTHSSYLMYSGEETTVLQLPQCVIGAISHRSSAFPRNESILATWQPTSTNTLTPIQPKEKSGLFARIYSPPRGALFKCSLQVRVLLAQGKSRSMVITLERLNPALIYYAH